ncbi:hypothetical protein [Sorangium sp. So ce341]|uniref:hypothetical protein n=1 Tax=Sorangium sp. So ce341 TaxID=3133302 RepID=UPI003F5E8295
MFVAEGMRAGIAPFWASRRRAPSVTASTALRDGQRGGAAIALLLTGPAVARFFAFLPGHVRVRPLWRFPDFAVC